MDDLMKTNQELDNIADTMSCCQVFGLVDSLLDVMTLTVRLNTFLFCFSLRVTNCASSSSALWCMRKTSCTIGGSCTQAMSVLVPTCIIDRRCTGRVC